MIHALRAEFRKLYTVRSTYGILAFTFAISVLLIGFWIYGYKDVERAVTNKDALLLSLQQTVNTAGIFLAFLALLSVGHEYRYNTVLYAMTANNRRSKIFFSKFIAVNLAALLAGAAMAVLGAVGFYIGQAVAGTDTVSQAMPGFDFLWRAVAVTVGGVSIAYVLGALVRSQILSIATFLVMPTFIEGLMSLLLKENVKYLPFTALGNILTQNPTTNPVTSALTVGAYVAVLGLAAYVLFLKRDAN